MRVLVARAGRHSRQRCTISAPPRGHGHRLAGHGPSGHGGAPGEFQCADRPLVSRLPELGLRLAAGTTPAGLPLSRLAPTFGPAGQPPPTTP
jgi:hypothetical protein